MSRLRENIIKGVATITRKHSFKGLQRVLNFIFPPSNQNKVKYIMNDYDNDLSLQIDTSSFIEWVTFFKGYYEPDVSNLLSKLLIPGNIVIDVGANVGIHTVLMAKKVTESGKVFAFEPHPEIADRLENNLNLNNYKFVKIIEKALSDKESKSNFYIYPKDNINKGISSLYKNHLEINHRKINIDVTTLDNFVKKNNVKKIDLIKIDTEGNDLKVLKGSEETIKKFSPHIIFEFEKNLWALAESTFSDIYDFLKEKNYKMYKICKQGKLKDINKNNYNNSMMVYAKRCKID